ncbi:hypothetical protein PC113_g6220 [Phytophthora cactorum]|uniref:ubiquitinyl hydrolase 1 n=1 Tax=Phytophthora cactorum TaxID=29920 RepID=A0A8T0ZHV8_9STRA|nr:hypothetical protein PC113_g6220 [Phytophthora cactorum]
MFHDEKGLQTFCSTLKRFSETLEQTPRRYECVPLLSELAGYVHQFTPDAKLIVELFAGMATRWAENLKQQYEVESSTEKIAAYRQKECILYGFALLAYTLGEWDDDAAQSVCKLVVLFRTSFLCASINVAATDDMLRVESRVAEMMSRRITELIAKVETIGSNSVLTALTGEELFIQELTVGAAGKVTDILQLCSAQWIQTFSTMFPVRLQELYSHWYWEEKNCILFRPKEAKNRKVLFVARFDESGALHCYKVPFCDWELLYQEILDKLDNYDRFVQKESLLDVLQVLTKFEDKNFLHPLKSPEGMITIELPRFQLAFCLNSNQKFESVEHKGYILAINQQFDDFLTRHSRYLVLELQDKSDTARPKLRMLLPVGSMREDSEELKAFGGIQVVAPEHRMSLELKRFELDKDDEVFTEILDEILDNGQYIDVLDECDAVLHHKYHLVYAAGHPIALSNGVERWQVAEAVLGVIASKSSESRVAKVLQAPHVSCSTSNATPPGACKGTRLNTVVDSTEPLRKELKKALALDLIDNSELMWLNMLGKGVARDSLITAITDSTVSLQTALGEHMQKLLSYINQLLALRGLIAFGVLEHCLEKRYRVDFGLPLPDTRPKKIAIPFRAADVPSEQSEFSHPDVCIALTLLGYYHRGLSDKEVQLTFEKLLRLDISEQIHQYDRWYASFKTLCNFFRFCMETINFFLNTDVFPKDTQQYPQRLSRTAWGIAAGGNNIGFSGTNDNHRLLPLSVTQLEPVYPLLLGTNGDMLHKIMQESHGYEVVGPSLERSQVPWQSVLLYALGKGVQALIDTGALLAGVMNHKAAEFLLERSDFAFAGVTYFHNRNKTNCWVVAEKDRRLVLPLKESSMLEKDTFVIFDEARSRGSDMKLPPNASAVLTLGPRLTKDKLMQGAGRMRQLGRNQTLWIASFDEVAQSILQAKTTHCGASDLTAVDVLNWVVDNTKAESVNGLLEWAGNGFHYQKTQYDQKEEWVPEDWSLEMLYQEKLHAETITHIIESKARSNFEGIDDDVVSQIRNSGRIYGLEDEVCVTAHTDECERELEVEEKVQEQQNLEVAHCSPAQEKTWNYAEILRVQSIEELDGVVRVYALVSFIRQWIYPKTFADLAWSTTHIFGTENFFSTVLQAKNEDQMNEYLRFIDVILVFVNGQVLLVSECEADHILQLLWSSASCSFRFVNLAFAWDSVDELGSTRSFRTSTWL